MKGPLNPHLMEAWNSGRKAGRKEALQDFHLFLGDKMSTLTQIDGVGAKMAKKIMQHVLLEVKN